MSLLQSIGGLASLASQMLSGPAQLLRGETSYQVNARRVQTTKPYRATENRRPYDAQISLDAATSPVEPHQNDRVMVDGTEWLVWRILPSSAGSRWMLECLAVPTVAIVPVQRVEIEDSLGGVSLEWGEDPEKMFYAKVREASTDRQLTAETSSAMGRLAMAFQASDAPADFDTSYRVIVDGRSYEVLSLTTDDENPMWRNAVLAREGAA